MSAQDLRAQADRDLAQRILADFAVKQMVERFAKESEKWGARRELLAMALRLSAEIAPDVDAIVTGCGGTLGLDAPVETYVYPGPLFNAAAARPERGRLFVLLSSSLLEAFEPDELRFVVGHELAHHLFEHHHIPVPYLLAAAPRLGPGMVLQLFAWQRYAEISADRAGVVCAGSLDAAARSLFKLASGLKSGRVQVHIEQFLSQVGDLREEVGRLASGDAPVRSDWFATHPFSPLRLRAAQLFADSTLMQGAMPREELEMRTQDLLTLMDPSYLQERSDAAEAMRRLLFAAGVVLASTHGDLSEPALAALESLLGEGSIPSRPKPDVLRAELPRRSEDVKARVPPLRRAQVIRDLCLIACADRRMDDHERRLLVDIASAVGVDTSLVDATLASHGAECMTRSTRPTRRATDIAAAAIPSNSAGRL